MPAMVLADLYSAVYDLLENNNAFYPESQVHAALRSGLRWLNLCTGILRTSDTIALVPGQFIYDIPTKIMLPTRVAIPYRVLERTSIKALKTRDPGWLRSMTSSAQRVPEFWAMFGARKILIGYPPVSSGMTATVEGIMDPELPASPSGVLVLPDDHFCWLTEYAAAECMLKAGGAVAQTGMEIYRKITGKIMEDIRKRAKGSAITLQQNKVV